MPPKKRKAVGSKREATTATAAKTHQRKMAGTKTAAASKKSTCKPAPKKRAAQLPCTSPAARMASKAATRKANIVKVTAASATKTKAASVRAPSSSSSSHTSIRAASQHAASAPERGPTAEKIAASSAERRNSSPSPQPPVAAKAAAATTPAPATRAHRKSATVKQPPRTDEELDDGGGIASSATEEKRERMYRKDSHDDATAAPSTLTARTSTATRSSRPIVVVTINDDESEQEDVDGEDTILFGSDVVDATRSDGDARQSQLDAPPPPDPSLVASTAAAVEQHLVTSPVVLPTHPLRLLHGGAGGRGSSSSATLDLCGCTTPPPPPLLQPTVRGTRKRTSYGSNNGAGSPSRQSAERSPEALMADSESKPGSHRWQRQLLAGGTPATQRLREKDALQDGGHRQAGSPPAHAAETVKQLFTEPARSISVTSTPADDSPNGTLIMSHGSEEDGVEEADAPGLHRRQRQHHQHLPPPLDLSSIATHSDSESQWSVGRATEGPPLPPGSATAVTPPPLPSLVPRASSAGGAQLFHRHHRHNSGGVTDGHCRGASTRLLSALKDDEASPSLQHKAVASAAQSFPAPAGRLRMGGSTSRQSSPSSSYVWLKRTAGGDAVEASHPAAPTSSATSTLFPAHPPFQQQQHQHQHQHQQQWSSCACPHLSFTSPSSSQLSRLADMDVMTEANADANAEGGHAATAATPQRLRLREPPVWRSPQITQLPKSLSVSPVSLRGDGRKGGVKGDAASSLPQSLSRTQPAAHSASAASSSTGEATQTLAQASANAAGGSQAPLRVVPSGSTAAPVASRPSTQLITKAAATRPIASPGTMWICLDDDDYAGDDNHSEGEGGVGEAKTAAPLHNGSDAPLVSVKMEIDAETDAVYAPPERTAAAAASPSPSGSPHKGGVAVGGEEQTEAPGRLRSRRPSPSKADSVGAGVRVDESSIPVLSPAQARRRPPAEKSHPIAEILSPTFRPRRRPPDASADPSHSLGAGSATHQRLSSWPASHCYINLDDDTEDEDAEEAPPRQRARNAHVPDGAVYSAQPMSSASVADAVPALLRALPVTGVDARSQLLLPLIIDDDDDEGAPEGGGETHTNESGDQEVRREGLSPKLPKPKRGTGVEGANEVVAKEEDDDDLLKSPQKPHVKDFIFPNRLDPGLRPSSPLYRSIHAYQQQYQRQQLAQGKEEEEHAARHAAAAASPLQEGVNADCRHLPQSAAIPGVIGDTKGASPDDVAAAGQAGQKRSRAKDAKTGAAAPALPDWGRPADTLLRDFFPTKFTKKSFMEAANNVMSPMHFLEAGDFWAAFASAEFVGEGSFGLVWRCLTVDGDLVAVKSCPIILRTKANIEDSFSTIREIATMRFLNEMQVPYVLPLHSAFFVHAQEALPPLAQEALEWRQRLRKRAEEAALEVEVRLLARGGNRRVSHTGAEEDVEDAPLTLEQQVAVQMERLTAAEGPEEQATRARLQSVRLPRFLSITHDDLTQSDATVFLVMELCDGDVEGISRSDGVAKGMVYCVSSALAAMHELGLLHLDLKPSNILFAYEHGPSQQRLQRFSTSLPATDAVKFYLSDFGNCRLVGPDPMDEVQDSYGTFEYMDLRALRDAVCGRPTDAFSLGATLYELLYGRRLYPKCVDPRCGGEEDHSRECFVEAASQPVVLPTVGPPTTAAMVTPVTKIGLNAAFAGHARGPHANGGTGSTSGLICSGPALTPLQYLTLALLRKPWAERMTAEECRRYLVQTFHITQTEDSSP